MCYFYVYVSIIYRSEKGLSELIYSTGSRLLLSQKYFQIYFQIILEGSSILRIDVYHGLLVGHVCTL